MESAQLQYLVVGTGRSGSLYAAKLLTALGIPCSHERIFNGSDEPRFNQGEGSACSKHFGLEFAGPPRAESSYMAVPFLQLDCLKESTIVHLVRDPLQVVASFLNNLLFFREERAAFRHPQEQFLYHHLPHLEMLPDPVSRACYYWLRWNQWIEESIGNRRYFLYRLEQGPQALVDFLGHDSRNLELPEVSCNAYSQWPDHMRVASDLPAYTAEEIQSCFLWKEVATLAAKYGYSRAIPSSQGQAIQPPRPTRPPSGSHLEKPLCYPLLPRMVHENFHNFNIIQSRDIYYAVHQHAGPLDLNELAASHLDELRANGLLFRHDSLAELLVIVRHADSERKQDETLARLQKVQEQGVQIIEAIQTLEVVYRFEAQLRNMNEAIHRTEASLVRLRPWYRKVAGKVKRSLMKVSSLVFST